MKKIIYSKKILWSIAGIFTLFRLFLFTRMPIHALANAMHDDQLMVQLANYLQNFQWLGPYTNRTLVKGIAFPVFLAVCNLIHIPYLLALGLLYIGSVTAFIQAIKVRIQKPWILLVLYLFFLYSPAMLSSGTGQRVYNMALLPSAVLLVAAGFVGMYFRRKDSFAKLLPYGIIAGIGFPFFWYLRDDSLWLLPFAAGAAVILIICFLKGEGTRKQKLTRILLPLLPFLIWTAAHFGICSLNYMVYGTFTTNERTQSSQTEMMANLFRIESKKPADSIWLTHETLNQAMDVSPTLASIREELDAMFTTNWASDPRAPGEIPGDIIVWAIRDAVYSAGYYSDGAVAEAFYAQVNDELKEAFSNGSLTKSKEFFPSAISNGIGSDDILPLLTSMKDNLLHLVCYDYSQVVCEESTGTQKEVRFFESMTGNLAIHPTEAPTTIRGWALSKVNGEEISLAVLDSTGNKIADIVFEESPDLAGLYPEYPQSSNARFCLELDRTDADSLLIQVSVGNTVYYTGSLAEASMDTDTYSLCLDEASAVEDSLKGEVQGLVNISNKIIFFYQLLGFPLFVIAVFRYIQLSYLALQGVRRKTWAYGDLWLVTTALLGSCALLLAAVCWFTAFLAEGSATIYYYSTSALTIIQIFQCLTIAVIPRRS